MSFDSLTNSSEFNAFLLANNAAFPTNFSLKSSGNVMVGRLINTNSNNNSRNIELSYYDEVAANNGVEFIRLYWFNNESEPVYFKASKEFKKLSPQELKKQQENKIKREKIEAERKYKACQTAQNEYINAAVPCKQHNYLNVKNILAHYGVKICTQTISYVENGNTIFRMVKGDLIIPIISLDKKFMGYQRIRPDGVKLQCRDGLKRLGFFPMGGWNPTKKQKIVLCEGYATGATIYECTGYTTFVCFDVGNIQALATEMAQKYPHIELILATDFDIDKNQAGLLAGLQLSQQFNLKFTFPFTLVDGGSDWNDLQAQSGREFVKKFFNEQIEQFEYKSLESISKFFYDFLTEENREKVAA
jgi:putative DNA primase/helicase